MQIFNDEPDKGKVKDVTPDVVSDSKDTVEPAPVSRDGVGTYGSGYMTPEQQFEIAKAQYESASGYKYTESRPGIPMAKEAPRPDDFVSVYQMPPPILPPVKLAAYNLHQYQPEQTEFNPATFDYKAALVNLENKVRQSTRSAVQVENSEKSQDATSSKPVVRDISMNISMKKYLVNFGRDLAIKIDTLDTARKGFEDIHWMLRKFKIGYDEIERESNADLVKETASSDHQFGAANDSRPWNPQEIMAAADLAVLGAAGLEECASGKAEDQEVANSKAVKNAFHGLDGSSVNNLDNVSNATTAGSMNEIADENGKTSASTVHENNITSTLDEVHARLEAVEARCDGLDANVKICLNAQPGMEKSRPKHPLKERFDRVTARLDRVDASHRKLEAALSKLTTSRRNTSTELDPDYNTKVDYFNALKRKSGAQLPEISEDGNPVKSSVTQPEKFEEEFETQFPEPSKQVKLFMYSIKQHERLEDEPETQLSELAEKIKSFESSTEQPQKLDEESKAQPPPEISAKSESVLSPDDRLKKFQEMSKKAIESTEKPLESFNFHKYLEGEEAKVGIGGMLKEELKTQLSEPAKKIKPFESSNEQPEKPEEESDTQLVELREKIKSSLEQRKKLKEKQIEIAKRTKKPVVPLELYDSPKSEDGKAKSSVTATCDNQMCRICLGDASSILETE